MIINPLLDYVCVLYYPILYYTIGTLSEQTSKKEKKRKTCSFSPLHHSPHLLIEPSPISRPD